MKPGVILISSALAAASLISLRGDDRKLTPVELPLAASEKMDFAKDIKPILERSRLRCHFSPQPANMNRTAANGGFSLSTREKALRGGDSGVAIVPGKSAESRLILLASGFAD